MHIAYGSSLFNKLELKDIAKMFVDNLPSDITCLLSSGSSGCALATAIMMKSRRSLHHVFVRKEQESAYRSGSAGISHYDYGGNNHVYAIVDDLIDTGKTVRRIIDWAIANGIDKHNIRCIMVGKGANMKSISGIEVKIIY